MRLVKDNSLAAHEVRVTCLDCGKMLDLSDAIVNLDGPAFRAYYHVLCLRTEWQMEYAKLGKAEAVKLVQDTFNVIDTATVINWIKTNNR